MTAISTLFVSLLTNGSDPRGGGRLPLTYRHRLNIFVLNSRQCFPFCKHNDLFYNRVLYSSLRRNFSPEATLHASRRLSAAAKEGDVLNALWCLAHGAIVNWANPDENGNLFKPPPPLLTSQPWLDPHIFWTELL